MLVCKFQINYKCRNVLYEAEIKILSETKYKSVQSREKLKKSAKTGRILAPF